MVSKSQPLGNYRTGVIGRTRWLCSKPEGSKSYFTSITNTYPNIIFFWDKKVPENITHSNLGKQQKSISLSQFNSIQFNSIQFNSIQKALLAWQKHTFCIAKALRQHRKLFTISGHLVKPRENNSNNETK